MFRIQGPCPNIENVVTLWDVIWLAFFRVETLVKVYEKCLVVSVFCGFLNKEGSVWHCLYIFVNLSKGATTFVKRAEKVAVFLVPWESFPKKEIGDSFIEQAVLLLNVVTKCHYPSSFLQYMPNRQWEPFTITRKIIITGYKNHQKIHKK